MNLFSKEKELILKITNAILLIWLITAICFVANNIVDLTFKDNDYNYDEYELLNCHYEDETKDDKIDCKMMYKQNKLYNEQNRNNYVKGLIVSCTNIIIVGCVIAVLNKNKKAKKK